MAVALDKYRDEELNHPREVFRQNGATVIVASNKKEEARGMLGDSVKPELTFAEAKADQYDAVVVVGGRGSPEYLWENTDLRGLLQEAYKQNKVVAGICLSGVVLAKAGLLKDRDATVYETPDTLTVLKECGARYKKEPVVVSGRVVTANGPAAARDFGKAVSEAILKPIPVA
jgi:protease I